MGALKCVTVVICILALNMALTTFTDAMPMVYKKNDQKNYEAGEGWIGNLLIQLCNQIILS